MKNKKQKTKNKEEPPQASFSPNASSGDREIKEKEQRKEITITVSREDLLADEMREKHGSRLYKETDFIPEISHIKQDFIHLFIAKREIYCNFILYALETCIYIGFMAELSNLTEINDKYQILFDITIAIFFFHRLITALYYFHFYTKNIKDILWQFFECIVFKNIYLCWQGLVSFCFVLFFFCLCDFVLFLRLFLSFC